jgi:hypothetical protein
MSEVFRLTGFIDEQLEREDAKLTRIVCVQIVRGNRLGDELRTIAIPDAGADHEWAERTARKLVDTASAEAVELGTGVQRYAVQAWFGSEDKSRARFVFTCRGGEDEDAISTESPDAEGLTAAAMRHTEFFARLGFADRQALVKDLREEVAKLRAENEQLRAEQLKSIKAVRELFLADAERAAAERNEQFKHGLVTRSVERLEQFLPHAVNAWSEGALGRAVFPQAAMQMAEAKRIADSFTDDDVAKIRATLGDEKASAIVKFATTVSKMPETTAVVPTKPVNGAPAT